MGQLKEAAVLKHSAFQKNFVQIGRKCVLLYQDYSVISKLPGSEDDFVLQKYRNLLGKQYSKITFHLCDKDLYLGEHLYK